MKPIVTHNTARLHIAVLVFIILSASAAFAGTPFTADEQAYIASKKTITVGVVDSNEPYTFYRNGTVNGYSIDVMSYVEEISGLRIEYRVGNWTDIYNSFLRGEIDALNEISYTKERSSTVNFTEPYNIREATVFTRSDSDIKADLESLKGRKVGVIKDIFYAESLKNKGILLVEYNSYVDMMKSLAFGWTDAVFASELAGRFLVKENSLSNIISLGPMDLGGREKEDLRLGVKKENRMLFSVLCKSLNAVTDEQLEEIEKRWSIYRGQIFNGAKDISLTKEEKKFIQTHTSISVGMLPDYYPFSFTSAGSIKGYSKSLLDLISAKTGLNFTYSVQSWAEGLKKFREDKINVIANISYTEPRTGFTLYTDEYARIPNVVFVRNDFGYYGDISSLKEKKLGITRDVFFKDKLNPELAGGISEYDSQDQMMKDLSFGKLDAVITTLNTGSNIIRKYTLTNITIADEFKAPGIDMEDLRFGITKDNPLLYSIFKKALASVSPEEKLRLENLWLTPQNNTSDDNTVIFTDKEKEFLQNKKIIRMCVDPDWMPFEKIDSDGRHTGMAADFIDIMRKNGDIDINLVPTESWGETIFFMQQRKCDIISLAMKTPERSVYMDFTTPYLVVPNVIATSINDPFINKIDDVMDKTLGTVKGYAIVELLKNEYPDIKIHEVSSDSEGISLLQQGKIYGYIGTMPGIGYQIRQQKIVDIKISGRLPQDWRLSVAVRNDQPMLKNIFQKLVNSISENQKNIITNNWMSVRYDQGFDYSLFWKILSIIFVLSLMVAYWSGKLRKLNKELNLANTKLRELSEKDELTNLYNRRYFSRSGLQTFSICQRSKIRFSIAIIDIDYFKSINDTKGHLFGDKCLQVIGEILHNHFQRQTDTLARFGGEEFAVFITGGGEDTLYQRLEHIRTELENTKVEMDGLSAVMTASAGVYSAMLTPEDTLDSVMKKADDALYQAKNSGRNKVLIWENGKSSD